MKVQVVQTQAALAQAELEALLLSQQLPGCVPLMDYHLEKLSSETAEAIVFIFMPCAPAS